jgi:hypothetical protein
MQFLVKYPTEMNAREFEAQAVLDCRLSGRDTSLHMLCHKNPLKPCGNYMYQLL